jgi:hypothetical protein
VWKVIYFVIFTWVICIFSCEKREKHEYSIFDYVAESPSKEFSYRVKEVDKNYQVEIYKIDEICYTDPEMYRMRDRFYITWDMEKDIIWVYSSDVGTYFFYFENKWIKREYKYYNYVVDDGSEIPQIIKELIN